MLDQPEVWKTITINDNRFNNYEASSHGRIRKKDTLVLVAIVWTGKPKYAYVNLHPPKGRRGGRKLIRLHRAVASAFHLNPNNLPVVDHISRDITDNTPSNLRWVDKSGNQRNTSVNKYIEHEGATRLLIEVCDEIFGKELNNISYSVIYNYMLQGMSFEKALEKRIRSVLDETKVKENSMVETTKVNVLKYLEKRQRAVLNKPPVTTDIK